jgi:hypothetical protein
MKKLVTICLVCVLTATAWGSYIVDFNENGNGQYSSDGGLIWQSLTYGFNSDGQFYYELPFTLEVEGILAIMEPGGTSEPSDVLGFANENSSRLYVFSEAETDPWGQDLADKGLPSDYPPEWTIIQTVEVGLENGGNGVTYIPGMNEPGFIEGGVTYNFISDIPEPATICMLGLGALSLIRRKK